MLIETHIHVSNEYFLNLKSDKVGVPTERLSNTITLLIILIFFILKTTAIIYSFRNNLKNIKVYFFVKLKALFTSFLVFRI